MGRVRRSTGQSAHVGRVSGARSARPCRSGVRRAPRGKARRRHAMGARGARPRPICPGARGRCERGGGASGRARVQGVSYGRWLTGVCADVKERAAVRMGCRHSRSESCSTLAHRGRAELRRLASWCRHGPGPSPDGRRAEGLARGAAVALTRPPPIALAKCASNRRQRSVLRAKRRARCRRAGVSARTRPDEARRRAERAWFSRSC